MRDAERRREIKDYYLGISADEITSYLTPASFDLWESVARYRRELTIGARWLEVGGGMGDLAAAALDRGYDVLMTDVQDELLETAATRHPRLRTRLQRVDIVDAPRSRGAFALPSLSADTGVRRGIRRADAAALLPPGALRPALARAGGHAGQRIAACTTCPSATSAEPRRRLARSSTSHPAPIPRLTEPAVRAAARTRSSRWARSRRSSVLSSTLRPYVSSVWARRSFGHSRANNEGSWKRSSSTSASAAKTAAPC